MDTRNVIDQDTPEKVQCPVSSFKLFSFVF
jgi:hypothetical protein